jgi:hypothetical protein
MNKSRSTCEGGTELGTPAQTLGGAGRTLVETKDTPFFSYHEDNNATVFYVDCSVATGSSSIHPARISAPSTQAVCHPLRPTYEYQLECSPILSPIAKKDPRWDPFPPTAASLTRTLEVSNCSPPKTSSIATPRFDGPTHARIATDHVIGHLRSLPSKAYDVSSDTRFIPNAGRNSISVRLSFGSAKPSFRVS